MLFFYFLKTPEINGCDDVRRTIDRVFLCHHYCHQDAGLAVAASPVRERLPPVRGAVSEALLPDALLREAVR
jgi:hypothetical protein